MIRICLGDRSSHSCQGVTPVKVHVTRLWLCLVHRTHCAHVHNKGHFRTQNYSGCGGRGVVAGPGSQSHIPNSDVPFCYRSAGSSWGWLHWAQRRSGVGTKNLPPWDGRPLVQRSRIGRQAGLSQPSFCPSSLLLFLPFCGGFQRHLPHAWAPAQRACAFSESSRPANHFRPILAYLGLSLKRTGIAGTAGVAVKCTVV